MKDKVPSSNEMANENGNISVSWPHESDPLWTVELNIQLKSIIPILKLHGFKHDALISSTFVLWQGSKQQANVLAALLMHSYPLFNVKFEAD